MNEVEGRMSKRPRGANGDAEEEEERARVRARAAMIGDEEEEDEEEEQEEGEMEEEEEEEEEHALEKAVAMEEDSAVEGGSSGSGGGGGAGAGKGAGKGGAGPVPVVSDAEIAASNPKEVRHEVAVPPGYAYKPLDGSLTVAKPAREYPFVLDPFQRWAIACIERGESVLVSAHTSAGKTVVAEYAIAVSLRDKQRVIYTSPIKVGQRCTPSAHRPAPRLTVHARTHAGGRARARVPGFEQPKVPRAVRRVCRRGPHDGRRDDQPERQLSRHDHRGACVRACVRAGRPPVCTC